MLGFKPKSGMEDNLKKFRKKQLSYKLVLIAKQPSQEAMWNGRALLKVSHKPDYFQVVNETHYLNSEKYWYTF